MSLDLNWSTIPLHPWQFLRQIVFENVRSSFSALRRNQTNPRVSRHTYIRFKYYQIHRFFWVDMNFFDLKNASKSCMYELKWEKCIPTIKPEHYLPKNMAIVSATRYLQELCTNRSQSSWFHDFTFWIHNCSVMNLPNLRFPQFEEINRLTILAIVLISELNTSRLLI